jgi:peptidyl-prolyl cis-trans isomerase SurA
MKMFDMPGESGDETRQKVAIDSIYQELQKGASFENLAALYSDDKNSSGQAGEMRAFTMSEMVPEFALAAFGLATNGAVSEPVRTEYGWHIIKRLELTPIGSFTDEYAHISTMMARDGRSNIGVEAYIKNKMKGSDFRLSIGVLSNIYELAQKAKDNEAFFASIPLSDEVLIRYYEDVITVSDFIRSLESDKAFNVDGGRIAIDKSVEAMAYQLVMHVENRDLAKNDLKYKYLAQEYFDGLLIFEISNNLIWQHVGEDTLALQNYYKNHLSEFTPAPVLQGLVCEVVDKRLEQRMHKRAEKSGEGDNLVQILKDMARKDIHYKCEEGSFKFAKGLGNPVDKKLLSEDSVLKHYKGAVYWDGEIVESEPLPYAEALGEVMSHFQQWKEENWVLDLREKHQPKFEYELLNK